MKETAFKYFEGRATDAELEQLLHWLRKKENRIVFNSYRLDWKKSLEPNRFPGGGEESWQRLQAALDKKVTTDGRNPGKSNSFSGWLPSSFLLLVWAVWPGFLPISRKPSLKLIPV
jgi:transmembrane sensor